MYSGSNYSRPPGSHSPIPSTLVPADSGGVSSIPRSASDADLSSLQTTASSGNGDTAMSHSYNLGATCTDAETELLDFALCGDISGYENSPRQQSHNNLDGTILENISSALLDLLPTQSPPTAPSISTLQDPAQQKHMQVSLQLKQQLQESGSVSEPSAASSAKRSIRSPIPHTESKARNLSESISHSGNRDESGTSVKRRRKLAKSAVKAPCSPPIISGSPMSAVNQMSQTSSSIPAQPAVKVNRVAHGGNKTNVRTPSDRPSLRQSIDPLQSVHANPIDQHHTETTQAPDSLAVTLGIAELASRNPELLKAAGQMLMVGFNGYEVTDQIRKLIVKYKVGCFILTSKNMKSRLFFLIFYSYLC